MPLQYKPRLFTVVTREQGATLRIPDPQLPAAPEAALPANASPGVAGGSEEPQMAFQAGNEADEVARKLRLPAKVIEKLYP
jgi:hypothetical protein